MVVSSPAETNCKSRAAGAEKLARIRDGGAPRVIDLFAGCGGLSLGFLTAGFTVVAAIESDPIAALSHALNFFKDSPHPMSRLHGTARDIISAEPH